MKDKAIEGIASARQKDKLANDAQVADRNKKGVGKRNNIPSKTKNVSSPKSPSLSVNQLNNQSLRNNISQTNNNNELRNVEAKKRLQNRNIMQNNLMKVAEKIPVASKYAKMAKMAEKIKQTRSNKGNPLKNIFSSNEDKQASPAEVEDALGAEQRGEEYNPEQTEAKFTVLTQKKLKLFAIIFSGGVVVSLLFLSVIFLASILDSGKEAFLASHEKFTEEEISDAYDATAEADADESE